jgi:hypothetical protein
MLTVQVPVPEQAPLQPLKALPGSAVAVSVTLVPLGKDALQRVPQLMLQWVTVPVPGPALLTLSVYFGTGLLIATPVSKVAVTLCAWFMLTVQAPVPEQAPPQPLKVLPESAVAVSVTLVPLG